MASLASRIPIALIVQVMATAESNGIRGRIEGPPTLVTEGMDKLTHSSLPYHLHEFSAVGVSQWPSDVQEEALLVAEVVEDAHECVLQLAHF